MNLLDVAIVVGALGAAIGGWRLGVVARGLAWTGVALGLLLAVPLLPWVVSHLGGADPDTRITAALIFLVLCGAGGQAVGIVVSAALHRRREAAPLSRAERIGGAALGATGVVAVVWMLLPSLAAAAGWPARAARSSTIVGWVDDVLPTPPDAFAAWGRAVADAPYPAALPPLDEPPDPGTPPDSALDRETLLAVQPSIVRVNGVACDRVQDGSGVVLDDELVVTNAHVVAGERATVVVDAIGVEHEATVVAFDPIHDLAVLHVDGFDAPSLELDDAVEGSTAAVFGFPAGGPQRIAPARIGETISARGTDIYRRGESTRRVIVLGARLAPGDSGAAVVDERGAVVGLAFAIDPGSATTAYALAREEIDAVLEQVSTDAPVETGDCVR